LGPFVPLDIDVSPFDNSKTKKEGVSRTYKGYDGFAPIFAYLGRCAARCLVDAITAEHAHDKKACYQKVKNSLKYCIKNYHIFIYGCGLCATGVPCESEIPKPLR
jgi:hypothetical protein